MDSITPKSSEQDQLKKLKRQLENWREVLLPLNSVFIWEKPFYPGCLAGFVTLLFLMLWYFDPSVLTTLSLLGMVVCLLDYLVPIISSHVFDPNKWSGVQEKQFENVCLEIVRTKRLIRDYWDATKKMKQDKPKMYFLVVLTSLLLAAWIGSIFDNLFLTYLMALVLIMLPGIKHNGILQKYIAMVVLCIRNFISHKMKKN